MPCGDFTNYRNDYNDYRKPKPDPRLARSIEIAHLLNFVGKKTGSLLDAKVGHIIMTDKPNADLLDSMSVDLCKLCTDMTEEQTNAIIYNARDPMSRKLADWWEHHQIEDAKNEAKLKLLAEQEKRLIEDNKQRAIQLSSPNTMNYTHVLRESISKLITKHGVQITKTRNPSPRQLLEQIATEIEKTHDEYFDMFI